MSPTWLYWPAAGGGSTPWAPSDLTSLVAWFKADAITGLSDADPVSTWSDSSGNSQDVTATSTERPIYKTSIQNSLPVVRFDGSNDRLKKTTSPITGTTARTIAVVAKADVVDSAGIIGMGVEATPILTGSGFDITPEVAIRVLGSRTFTVGFGTTSFRVLVVSCPASPTVTDVDGWLDGEALTQNTTTGTTLNTSGDLFIGERGQASIPSNFDGDVAEVVMCNAELSQSDREKLEGYLAHKWGLEGNLPPSHPYKNAAPTRTLWAPIDLTGLQCWLDASDSSTITESGGSISLWEDKTANDYDADDAVNNSNTKITTKRPTVATAAQNGLDAINFDGSQWFDHNTARGMLKDRSCALMAVAMKYGSVSTSTFQFAWTNRNTPSGSTAAIRFQLTHGNTNTFRVNSARLDTHASKVVSTSSTPPYDTNWHIHVAVLDWAADTLSYYIDGSLIGTDSYPSGGANTSDTDHGTSAGVWTAIGTTTRDNSTNYPLSSGSQIGEMICGAISSNSYATSDREKLEGYLAHKWGLQGNLPVDHPYKISPPEAP